MDDGFEVVDYQTPQIDFNGKNLYLFRLPAGLDKSILDGASITLPSQKSLAKSRQKAKDEASAISVGSLNRKITKERYSFDLKLNTVECDSIRLLSSSSNEADVEDSGVLRAGPAFDGFVDVRRDVKISKDLAHANSSLSNESLRALPGIVLGYEQRTQLTGMKVRCAPPGAILPRPPLPSGKDKQPESRVEPSTSVHPPQQKKRKAGEQLESRGDKGDQESQSRKKEKKKRK